MTLPPPRVSAMQSETDLMRRASSAPATAARCYHSGSVTEAALDAIFQRAMLTLHALALQFSRASSLNLLLRHKQTPKSAASSKTLDNPGAQVQSLRLDSG
jgi:hypothetical protein